MKDLAIIILNWNGERDTLECIQSIYKTRMNMKYSIFIYDNGSEKDSVDSIESFVKSQNHLIISSEEFVNLNTTYNQEIIFIKGKDNIGFARANNCVMRSIGGQYKYFFLLNNDTIVKPNAVTEMYDYLEQNKGVDVLTCRINYYDTPSKLWNAGGKFTWYGDRRYYTENEINNLKIIECDFVTGCALMIKSTLMDQIGYFSEKFFFGEEDFNLCKRLKKNKNCVRVILNTKIYHKVSSSMDKLSSSYVNKVIVHYLNRIIDQRDLINNNLKWEMWKTMYLCALSIKCVFWQIDLKNIYFIIQSLLEYSKCFDEVGKKEFEYIMQRKGRNVSR